ncbi:helix-turn-helix transcriptional regulator [Fictibacillus enclensis]|uniref:helix-turn-helix transcriptional regulator n=1 Tax=Fictibacillus enclensis TaxID=1017270 RepID=UPI0025A156A5|nr:helix-turn-helix transcriptional regulator [Fictibacillus enclensis]MDM5337236.1 helix-turn-helix transcriptional regulator [Fictibacillus enclensis]
MIDGKKVFFYRIKKGLTQKAACEGICSVSYLSKIENNSITPSPEILELLCERLGIEYSYVSEEAINNLKKEMHVWYKDIKYRNKEAADQKFNHFQSRIMNMDDTGLINLFMAMSARYYIFINDMVNAKRLLDKLNEVRKISTSEIQYYTIQFTGHYEYLQNNYKTSLDYFKQAYLLSRKLGIQDEELFYLMGNISTRLGYFSQSIYYIKTALEIFNADANFARSIDCHILQGMNYSRLRDFETAHSHYTIALNASHFNPALQGMLSTVLHNLGHSYLQAEQYEEALSVSKKGLREKKGENIGNTICLIADIYYHTNRSKEAMLWVRKGYKAINNEAVTPTYLRLKTLEFKINDQIHDEAYQQFIEEEALPFLEKTQDRLHLIEMYEELAAYYSAKFSYKNANHYYAKVNQLYKEYL